MQFSWEILRTILTLNLGFAPAAVASPNCDNAVWAGQFCLWTVHTDNSTASHAPGPPNGGRAGARGRFNHFTM